MQVRKMTGLELRMTEDFNWAQKAREVKQNPAHYGQFVVVHNKRVWPSVGTARPWSKKPRTKSECRASISWSSSFQVPTCGRPLIE